MNFKENKKFKKILLYFVRILTIVLFGLGIGYYFFPGVTLGLTWQSSEKSLKQSSNYFVDKNINETEKPYIDLYNNEHYGLKYIFSDGYFGFNSYLIARDNFLSLDPDNKEALVANAKLAYDVNRDIYSGELRNSIFNAMHIFNILIVNNEFTTIIGGSLIAGTIIIISAFLPYVFYNYYYYNSVNRTALNVYYYRMKRKEKRKKLGKNNDKKPRKELQKISKQDFLEIYFYGGEYDYLKKDFNAEENLMFHKQMKMILKIGWIFILSAIILIICDALIVINREIFYGPLFIAGYVLCAPFIMFFLFLRHVYIHLEINFKLNTNCVIDWPFHGKLLWHDDFISTSELFPYCIIDFNILRNDSISVKDEYLKSLYSLQNNSTNFNTKTWLLNVRQRYYTKDFGW